MIPVYPCVRCRKKKLDVLKLLSINFLCFLLHQFSDPQSKQFSDPQSKQPNLVIVLNGSTNNRPCLLICATLPLSRTIRKVSFNIVLCVCRA